MSEAQARSATARAAARTARLTPGLTLTLTAEYASETPHWGYGGAADIPLDVGARRSARTSAAELEALKARYDIADAAWSVRAELRKSHVDLEFAQMEIGLAEQVVALRGQRLERLQRRVAGGEDERKLALVAQTELSTSERRLAEARGRREAAVVGLAKALGVSPGAVRDLTLAPTAEPPALPDLAAWRQDAALYRPEVLKAVIDYDLAEAALRLEVAKQYPEVRISPGYTYDHGVTKLPFSLSVGFPTYDLNRRAIQQAELARTASGRSLELVQANALTAVDAAVAALAGAQATEVRIAGRELPAARAAAADARRALNAGEGDRVDDLAARAVEVEAELNLLDARRAARTAAADLEDALRRAFDPADAAVLQAALAEPGANR